MKILITGSGGQLGLALQALAKENPQLDCLFLDQAQVDLADGQAWQTYLKNLDFQACIHTAAYTAVDKAEAEPDLAYAVNAQASKILAQACAERAARLVYVSTDYVYHDEQHNRPFLEDHPISPKNTYAKTKAQGETYCLEYHPQGTYILRTAWVYAPWGQNFVRTILKLGQERPSLKIVADQIGSPTYAPDLAQVCLQILQTPSLNSGIYHFSNEGCCSWYDFAHRIIEKTGLNCQILPQTSKDYPTAASRPPFSLLDKSKIKSQLQISIQHWDTALNHCLKTLGYPLA